MARKVPTQIGSKAIRAHFEDAMRDLEQDRAVHDPDPSEPRGGIKPGQWPGAPWSSMPPDCPVKILGMKGQTIFAVSATGDLHAIERWDLPTLTQLFAPYTNYMLWAWPAFGKAENDPETGEPLPPRVKRLERDKAVMCLITEAGRRGTFDPHDNVRGRGGWKTRDGFVWHSGERIWTVKHDVDATGRARNHQLTAAEPAEHHGSFYAKAQAIIAPWASAITVDESPAHQLLQDLQSWNWERRRLDPLFLLGWVATAFMGGALEARPIVFTTGGKGVGKSTLHGILRAIFGSVLYSTANTTAAGIYQNIGRDSRPVAVDEFEAKSGGQKEQSIIELARQAYSGAKLYRGGSNHEGVEFELRSSFLFSAILHPPLGVQDKSRMAILKLRSLDKSEGRHPVIREEAGRMILRQVMDSFYDFESHLLPRWRGLLNRAGFDARAIDTYGTLLAAAELLVGRHGFIDAGFPHLDGQPDEAAIIDHIRMATAGEMAEQIEKWQDVVETLLASPIDQFRGGERMTIGRALEDFELTPSNPATLAEARQRLEMAGLGLRPAGDPSPGYCLAVPNSHPALDRIFEGTDYHHGGWTQALRQAPDEIVPRALEHRHQVIKINKISRRCVLVDMAAYERLVGVE
jgi:hypothetical protein